MGTSQLITYKVSGNSMNPLLYDGDMISAIPMPSYKIGDIVVATHPIQTDLTIVKQITEVSDDGRFRLRSTNSEECTDHFGLLEKEKIIGKVDWGHSRK